MGERRSQREIEAENASLRAELGSLRDILDQLGAHLYTKDVQSRYTFANAATVELFGRPLEEIVGKSDEAFFDPEMSQRLRDNDQLALAGELLAAEEIGTPHTSGGERCYWAAKAPMRDATGKIIGICGLSIDITRRKQLEADLEAQHKLLDTVLDNVDAYIYMKSRDRRYLYVNRQWASLFGTTPEAVIGQNEIDILPAPTAERFWELDQAVFQTQERQAAEEPALMSDGRVRHFWSVKVPLADIGQPDTLIGLSTDVTELRELREELEHQLFTDLLTGVSTRRYFLREAEHHVVQAQRYGRPLSLLIIDLDDFKRINDSYGHAAGDAVLVAVAQAFSSTIRQADLIGRLDERRNPDSAVDLIGRLGGEEFALLLVETDLAVALTLADRLRQAVEALRIRLPNSDVVVRMTTSVGVASLRQSHSTQDALRVLMAQADSALYSAKADGRNRVRAYEPGADQR